MQLNKKYMALAIKEARKNLSDMAGGPFGACIVKGGKLIGKGRNRVLKGDATCHAEINAIREASRKLGTYDLSGCCIYSTTEPCPMCFSAIHWARIDTIVYGTKIAGVKKLGFNELTISNLKMKKMGRAGVKIIADFMREECASLLANWDRLADKVPY